MPEYLIEDSLPISYLTDLGRYVQTCAHAEDAMCSAICKLEGLSAVNESGRTRHDQLRLLPTKELITAFSRASKRCEEDIWREYFKNLSAWLHQTIESRHLAIHGVHLYENSRLTITAPPKNGRGERRQTITTEDIEIALQGANEVLGALRQFLNQ